MSNKIAVILDDAKHLASFDEGTTFFIYYKEKDIWQLKGELRYTIDFSLTSSDIRDYIRTLILKMDDCKIVLGKSLTGLAYSIFNRMGFEIFEADTLNMEMLDEISSEVDNYKSGMLNSFTNSTAPIETDTAGVYAMSLIELQEKHPEISSKKALQPFIETTPFFKLEVICNHIPPWFDSYLLAKKLIYNVEDIGNNTYKAIIMKKVCAV